MRSLLIAGCLASVAGHAASAGDVGLNPVMVHVDVIATQPRISFEIEAYNIGDSAVTGVEVVFSAPTGLSLVGSSPSVGMISFSDAVGVWSIGAMQPSEFLQATITLAAAMGEYEMEFEVVSNEPDEDPSNNHQHVRFGRTDDCNMNGVDDWDEVNPWNGSDVNNNLIPDACERLVHRSTDGVFPRAFDTFGEAIASSIDPPFYGYSTVQIRGTASAFAAEPEIDLSPIDDVDLVELQAFGDLVQPAGGLYRLARTTSVETEPGHEMILRGRTEIGFGSDAMFISDVVTVDGGSIRVGGAGAALFDAPATFSSGAALEIEGGAAGFAHGASFGESASIEGFGVIEGDLDLASGSTALVVADMVINGGVQHEGTITVQNGALTVLGGLSGGGSITGDGSRSESEVELFIGGDLTLSEGGAITPAPSTVVRLGGAFDVAISQDDRIDLRSSELRVCGLGGAQEIEAMSEDVGAQRGVFSEAIDGVRPIGTLRIGPTASVAVIVDEHDNAPGSGGGEAVYARILRIDAGATLVTNGRTVYYEQLIGNGEVDNPLNLVRVASACLGDTNGDGLINFTDVNAVLVSYSQEGEGLAGDLDGDGVVGFTDLNEVLVAFGTACD